MIDVQNFAGKTAALGAASLAAALVTAAPAAAQTCAFRAPGWTNPAGEKRPTGRAKIVRLVRIALDSGGGFAVKTAERRLQNKDYDAYLGDLAVETDAAEKVSVARGSPLDLSFNQDAEIVFQLDVDEWDWDAKSGAVFALKPHTRDGLGQPHNPFGEARPVPGRPRAIAVRYDPAPQYRGCTYQYNLSVVVDQGGAQTPLVIDPEIKNGGGGN